jgi:hypothetical protein
VLGFDPHGEPVRFETFFQRIHPHDQTKIKEKIERVRREKAKFELDYRIVHPGGEIRDIQKINRLPPPSRTPTPACAGSRTITPIWKRRAKPWNQHGTLHQPVHR